MSTDNQIPPFGRDAMRFRIHRREFQDRVGMSFYYYAIVEGRPKLFIAKPVELEFSPLEEGQYFPPPTISFSGHGDHSLLQAMADELLDFGQHPKGVDEIRGELKAAKEHLADMQKLVKLGEEYIRYSMTHQKE